MGKKVLNAAIVMLSILSLHAQESGQPGEKETAIEVKTIKPYTYIAVEMKGSYEQHEQAFGILYQESGTQGITLADYPFGIYYNNPQDTPQDSLVWEIGTAISDVDSVTAPLVLKTFPFTSLASMIYEGAFNDEMQAAYGQLYGWIFQNGYQVAGPLQEMYMTMPSPDENGSWVGQVEILVPVQKTE
jgi:effector-binding domain-containing protein